MQLLVLLVLAHATEAADRDLAVAGFGLLSTFAMITDSGAGNYILATRPEAMTRRIYDSALLLHIALGTCGALAAVAIAMARASSSWTGIIAVLCALAFSQVCDSACRVARTPALAKGQDAAYALPDIALVSLKLPIVAVALISGSTHPLLLLPVASGLVLFWSYAKARASMPVDGTVPRHLLASIFEFGITGTLSAFYSQAPLLVGSWLLPLGQLADLAVAFRLVQAMDMIPGTLSLQLIPRVRDRGRADLRWWTWFVLGGAVGGFALLLAYPLVEVVFAVRFTSVLVFAFATLSFIPKSGNYALMSFWMGLGLIRGRLVVTIGTVFVSILLSVILGLRLASIGLGISALLVELVFGGISLTFLLARRRSASTATLIT